MGFRRVGLRVEACEQGDAQGPEGSDSRKSWRVVAEGTRSQERVGSIPPGLAVLGGSGFRVAVLWV